MKPELLQHVNVFDVNVLIIHSSRVSEKSVINYHPYRLPQIRGIESLTLSVMQPASQSIKTIYSNY
jgi:hypothetical protein